MLPQTRLRSVALQLAEGPARGLCSALAARPGIAPAQSLNFSRWSFSIVCGPYRWLGTQPGQGKPFVHTRALTELTHTAKPIHPSRLRGTPENDVK